MRYRNGGAERQDLVAAVERNSNIEVLTGASCFGIYEDNLVAIVQRDPCAGVAERLIHVRARLAAVATGVYEAPLLFANNDLPGIMLSTGVQRLIRLHGIKPGDRAVIVGTAERAAELQADLKSAGVTVAATVPLYQVLSAKGSGQVTGILTRNGSHACDLIVVCGYLVPDAGLLHQTDGSLQWDKEANAFVPSEVPDHVIAIGGVTGRAPGISNAAPPAAGATPPSSFVCLCADATAGDISGAVSEGFDEIELVKRYTTATMGPCQGKMCQITSIGLCASATGRSMGQTGVTTSRPPNPSVSLDALAGPRHHPARHTPMHHGHDALGAVWLDMGDWKRPRFYRTAESADESLCVRGEYKAVREHAGIIDVSTLGKLDVKGRDVGKLLDKVYTGRLSDMKPGRTRYGVICDEAGVMLDDGTVSRLDDEHYFITTTTGNLDFVEQWLLWWTAGTDWDVHVTNMTPGLAAINLAGPAARDVLRKLTSCDLESKAFPYMACRAADVAGVPAWLFRIGFVGETGWEIHFPADYGHHVWQALLEAGKDVDIRAFGVEAQRLLRLEKRHVIIGVDTDALTSPFASQMGWVAKLDKPDFVGRISLLAAAAEDPRDILTGFVMQDDVVPEDGAPVVIGGKPVGRVTSARFSPAREAGIGLAWVPRGSAADGSPIFIRVQAALSKLKWFSRPFTIRKGFGCASETTNPADGFVADAPAIKRRNGGLLRLEPAVTIWRAGDGTSAAPGGTGGLELPCQVRPEGLAPDGRANARRAVPVLASWRRTLPDHL